MTKALSQNELKDFYSLVGREVDPSLINPNEARGFLSIQRISIKRAQRYRCRVWSKFDIQTYLSEQARECVNFAVSFFFNDSADKFDSTYLLKNPHGRRHPHLGQVHFRTATPFSFYLPEDAVFDNLTPCVAIERITLHPSIQKTGFLNMLAEQMRLQGIKMLVLQHVYNPSFAYHLFQTSLETNSNILLLSDASTINFETCISPGPTFGLKLTP